ncbi:MAG: T9SS type A sorting domain-containing protein [Candidatus Aegiribacteria sp.]|nr:T9SS type A sorting domain-containing protein [Candidatus Aegiribacteria sp.]
MKIPILAMVLIATLPAFGQFIEFSFPSPSPYISGLAYNGDLFALDSLSRVLYKMNENNGTVLDTISIPDTPNPPVGLTAYGDTLWFAESGTGIVHKIDIEGNELAVYDLSDSGPQSITGLAHFLLSEHMFIMDASSTTLYVVETPIGLSPVEVFLVIEDCPEVHDISAELDYSYYVAVACEDSVSPVRLYYDSTSYESLIIGEFESAVGVASWDWCRFYFTDPSMGMIHRYCCNMGGGITPSTGTNGNTLTTLANPSSGTLEFSLNLAEGVSPVLTLMDISGRLIEEIPEGYFSTGTHSVRFEGLPPGVYFCVAARNGLRARGVIVESR